MDFTDDEREMLFSSSMKKLRVMLKELRDEFNEYECHVNVHVPAPYYDGYTDNPIEPVVAKLNKKTAEAEKLLRRCEGYLEGNSLPKCYKVLMLTYKMHVNELKNVLEHANALLQMCVGESFADFMDEIDGETRKINMKEKTGVPDVYLLRFWNISTYLN